MEFFDLLKASKGLPVRDPLAVLWGKQLSTDWPVTEITGSLPLTFESKGGALSNYRVYGTTSGVGDETGNLVTEIIQNASIGSTGKLTTSNLYNASIAPITAGTTYTLLRDYTTASLYYAFFTELPAIGSVSYDGSREDVRQLSVTITAPVTGYVVLLNKNGESTVAEGNTAIPYGYQIPLTVTSGAQSITTPVYIGSTKLYEEESVDYQEQKVYKKKPNLVSGIIQNASVNSSGKLAHNDALNSAVTPIEQGKTYTMLYARGTSTSNMICGFFENYPEVGATTYNGSRLVWNGEYYTFTAPVTGYLVSSVSFGVTDPVVYEGEYPQLTPTDPPVPFEAIQTFSGENTLDSSENVGEVSVRGRIKEQEK